MHLEKERLTLEAVAHLHHCYECRNLLAIHFLKFSVAHAEWISFLFFVVLFKKKFFFINYCDGGGGGGGKDGWIVVDPLLISPTKLPKILL